MPPEKVRVIGSFGAGCYGHNGADDVAADAALLARVVSGRPVRVQWSRNDEHTWEPYGSAMMIDLAGALDSAGNIIAYDAQLWSDTQSTRPGGDPSALMPAWHLAEPRKMRRGGGLIGGASRNSEPLYDIANQRIIGHSFAGPLRVSALRGLGAYANVFAMECFMDELAHVAGADPVEFRLRHLKNPRATAVTEAAAKAFGWKDLRVANRGKGIAFSQYKNHATYCAVCVEVEVNPADGVVCLLRMVAAADAGQVINPDGLRNQIEGGMIQSASWTLREQVTFNRRGITSFDWHSYPIIDFSEAPSTQVIVLDRPDQPPLGAGEAAQGPTGAAIANAIFSATGRRVRDLPITPQKITRAEPANA
jgi:CO/xanthine dehydrogenase Mo-binding subunit